MQPKPPENLTLGGSYLVGELLLSFVIATLVKLLESSMTVFEIMFYRYLFCLPLLFLYGRLSLGPSFLIINNVRILILRTICGFLGLCFWFLAVATIDISLATALTNTMPIFITILSLLIAKEKVGLRLVLAVFCGFIGVLILLLPVDASFNLQGTVYALLGAFFAGLMFVYIRMLGKSDATISTAIWYNSAGVIFSALLWKGLPVEIASTNIADLMLSSTTCLIVIGVLASFQQFFLAQSHRFADASKLAPLHYIAIPIGVIFGVVIFGEVITPKFVFGTSIIVGANYYIFLRERTDQEVTRK